MRFSVLPVIAAAMTGVLSAQARRVTPVQEVATLDELRPKTPDQVARSTFWTHQGRPLIETQRMRVNAHGMEDIFLSPLHEMFVWGRDICSSSAVIIGRPVFARTFLNKQETSLFTDFQIAIDRWIRPGSGNAQLLITMAGGRAMVAGKTLLEVDYGVFLEVGQVYALFLRWSSDVQAHFIHRRDPMPIAGSMVMTDSGRLRDQATFIKSVSDLASQCPKS